VLKHPLSASCASVRRLQWRQGHENGAPFCIQSGGKAVRKGMIRVGAAGRNGVQAARASSANAPQVGGAKPAKQACGQWG